MATFFASRALLAEGWQQQVRITVNQAGFIDSITRIATQIRLSGSTAR